MSLDHFTQSQFQLAVASTLTVAAITSLVVLLTLGHPNGESAIRQPTLRGEGDDSLFDDLLDVARPGEVLNGCPINEAEFWRKVWLWKLVICSLLGVIFLLEMTSSVWAFLSEDSTGKYACALRSVYAFYATALAGRAVYQNVVDAHATYIVHLATLTFIPTVLLAASIFIPSLGQVNTDLAQNVPLLLWLCYAVLVLYLIATCVTFTIPTGPALHFPLETIYAEMVIRHPTNFDRDNVCGVVGASLWDYLLFSYANKVVKLGQTTESLEIADLPILPSNLHATYDYATMKKAVRTVRWRFKRWQPKIGSGWKLGYRLWRVNIQPLTSLALLSIIRACFFYAAPFFLWEIISYLESDPERESKNQRWFYVTGLFFATSCPHLVTGRLWFLGITNMQVRLRNQLGTIVFCKMLVGKNFPGGFNGGGVNNGLRKKEQFMASVVAGVDRFSEIAWLVSSLVDLAVEIAIGTLFLYRLLDVSCFVGLALTCLFLPLNHIRGVRALRMRNGLLRTRAARSRLMSEILGVTRGLKLMAWERHLQETILKFRDRELQYQKSQYVVEVFFNAFRHASPILATIVSFWHFAAVRGQTLGPSIAFTSMLVFNEMKFSLNALPVMVTKIRSSFYSLGRIEKYLSDAEVMPAPPLSLQSNVIAFRNATISWLQDNAQPGNATSSAVPAPRRGFLLLDLSLSFPEGKLSLVCGRPGSGKTLMLHALLGEADVLAGQVVCPRPLPDTLVHHASQTVPPGEWVMKGVCAYVPQIAWLQNASIKENILFGMPYDEERYQKTLEACLLVSDLRTLHDGDESEVGERGINLSADQEARVCLARAVYSRASVLLLDDIFSVVDAHMTHHLYHHCIRGNLMRGRTIVLISHHVQLCMSSASYIVVFDNGRALFQGNREAFLASDIAGTLTLVHSGAEDVEDKVKDAYQAKPVMVADANMRAALVENMAGADLSEITHAAESGSETSSIAFPLEETTKVERPQDRKVPRKFCEDEMRSAGYLKREIWETYIKSVGGWIYWIVFVAVSILSALSPIFGNWWLKTWSSGASDAAEQKGPVFYVTIYATVTLVGVFINVLRFCVLYTGSINASTVLFERSLEAVLYARSCTEDTVSRECFSDRLNKDFETIDSSMADNFGESIFYGLIALTSFVTISVVDGFVFVFVTALLGYTFFKVAKAYSYTFLDVKHLDMVTRSRLHSIYGETVRGTTVLRVFGASSKFLQDMIRCVDMNANAYYWMCTVNCWLSIRLNLLSCALITLTGLIAVLSPTISASLAGFTFVFASDISHNVLFLVHRFVGLKDSMHAVKRVKEYSEFIREPAQSFGSIPPAYWPLSGNITCEDLTIRYAPGLPDVLHCITFSIMDGEKVGILGRAGSGKSTLALSLFRIVDATEGRIIIDGIDISLIGLQHLRSRLAVVTHDPIIISGTLRSTIDVFGEYDDAEIFEVLRRVHLISTGDEPQEGVDSIDPDGFRNLDSPVSGGGGSFSTGEKLLLSIARALLKRPKVLIRDMDEATSSLDYATEALINKIILREFGSSTVLTITRQPLPIIDYDRIMVLDAGRIVEFDRPATLLADRNSSFYKMCKSAGREEFSILKKRAGIA